MALDVSVAWSVELAPLREVQGAGPIDGQVVSVLVAF